jgi:hypothetical protein
MLPTGREVIWFGLGIVTWAFVIPWVRSMMGSRGQSQGG